jgi:hypothetical protein
MSDQKKFLLEFEDEPIDEVYEALFGDDPLEIDEDEAAEILGTYGINSEEIVVQFKGRLQERIRELNKDGSDNETLDNLQHFVRDISNYQRARSPDNVNPKSWISSILDATNKAAFPQQAAISFRSKDDEDLTEKDLDIIKEMEDRLNEDE